MPPLTGFQNIFLSFPGLRCCAAPPRATIYRPWPGLTNSVSCAHINAPHKLLFVGLSTKNFNRANIFTLFKGRQHYRRRRPEDWFLFLFLLAEEEDFLAEEDEAAFWVFLPLSVLAGSGAAGAGGGVATGGGGII